MGTIKYSLTKRNSRVAMRNEDGTTVKINGVIQYMTTPKWYAKCQVKEVLSQRDFLKYTVSHFGSVYGVTDLMACMDKVSACLQETLIAGVQVEFEDFGRFKAGLSSEGIEDATTFSTNYIKKSYANWTKPKNMKALVVEGFEQVSSVALRKAAIRANAQGKSQAGWATIALSVSTLDADGNVASGVLGGTVSGVGRFRIGDSTTIEANAADGYTFVGWRLPGSNQNINTSASYEVTLTGNLNYVAVFQAEE